MNSTHWLGKLANLNVARTEARGIAPHKPLMLLTVIDLIESGDIPDGWVRYDVRLVSRFRDYWELVQDRQRNSPDITMPFNALGSDRDLIWKTFTADGQPSKSKLTTRLCHLDSDLFACLLDASFRRQARKTLVSIYFTPREQVMLCARLGLTVPNTAVVAALKQDAAEFKASQKKGRDSRFKSDVLGGYYFTCALTGYRLDTKFGSIVQAAHIHQHAVSGNDDPATASPSRPTLTGCSMRGFGPPSPMETTSSFKSPSAASRNLHLMAAYSPISTKIRSTSTTTPTSGPIRKISSGIGMLTKPKTKFSSTQFTTHRVVEEEHRERIPDVLLDSDLFVCLLTVAGMNQQSLAEWHRPPV